MKPSLSFPVPKTQVIEITGVEGAGECFTDMVYAKQSPAQKLDLFLPETGAKPYPLVIYIHEGAFAFGDKRDIRIQSVLPVLREGYALATIEYRKSDEVTWPAQIYDAKAAVRYLRGNAGSFRLDQKRFAVWGVSAGAYLGSMLGVTANIPAFEDKEMGFGEESSEVQAVIDCFGCCGGFHRMDEQIQGNGVGRANHNEVNSPESIMMGNALPGITELCHLAAPSALVHRDIPPFLIQHGRQDPVTPVQQSQIFAGAIERIAGKEKVRLCIYEAGHHDSSLHYMPEAQQEAFAFLKQVFGS